MITLLFPPRCMQCHRSINTKEILCSTCHNLIKKIPEPHCRRCLQPFESPSGLIRTCHHCLQQHYHFDQLYSVGSYDGLLAGLCKKLKFEKNISLARGLGRLCQPLIATHYDAIIPVPLHRKTLGQRGFNQSLLLAQQLTHGTNMSCNRHGLKKQLFTANQHKLSQEQRRKNLQETFKATHSFHGETCLLIDDVLTTGATASACAKILKQAGALRVDVLTVARTL